MISVLPYLHSHRRIEICLYFARIKRKNSLGSTCGSTYQWFKDRWMHIYLQGVQPTNDWLIALSMWMHLCQACLKLILICLIKMPSSFCHFKRILANFELQYNWRNLKYAICSSFIKRMVFNFFSSEWVDSTVLKLKTPFWRFQAQPKSKTLMVQCQGFYH